MSYRETLAYHQAMLEAVGAAAPHAEETLARPRARRRATRYTTTSFEHIPPELLVHQLRGAAACESGLRLIEHAYRAGWPLDTERIGCPVRIVWGTDDRILPWPPAPRPATATASPTPTGSSSTESASPQLDVPLETAELILGMTASR